MITIRQPLCFSEIGRKDNQEDYLFPSTASTRDHVFILCDGMGGHEKGEVASRTAAEALGSFLCSEEDVTEEIFKEGLARAYSALDSIDNGTDRKPGTTMTCLCLNEENYLVAHIGDSRIYHIRPSLFNPKTGRGGILYQSEDHSLVNDLLRAGEITEEEARNFPQRNVITRAMQPHLEKKYKADIAVLNDIKGGDYFFLCCDGVLEQLSNETLCSILADKRLTDEGKIAAIKDVCDGRTKDNYSCWLIPIESVSFTASSDSSGVILADAEQSETESVDGKENLLPVIPHKSFFQSLKGRIPFWVILLFAVIITFGVAYFAYGYFLGNKPATVKPRHETVKKRTVKPRQEKEKELSVVNDSSSSVKEAEPTETK